MGIVAKARRGKIVISYIKHNFITTPLNYVIMKNWGSRVFCLLFISSVPLYYLYDAL